MKKYEQLAGIEARAADARGRAFEHSMAIEGIFLSEEEKALVAYCEQQRMGADEAVAHAIEWLKEKGIIPPS